MGIFSPAFSLQAFFSLYSTDHLIPDAVCSQWKYIHDLKMSHGIVRADPIRTKVTRKSNLFIYRFLEKWSFYVLVMGETASIRLMVYGSTMFRKYRGDKADNVLAKSQTVVAETGFFSPKEGS